MRVAIADRRPHRPDRPGQGTYLPELGLDEVVAGRDRRGDPVAAVPNEERLAVANELHRRCLAALLQPLPVSLDRRVADTAPTTLADSHSRQRHPQRLDSIYSAHRPSFQLVDSRR
jgi:hypothetical protein